MLLPRCDVDCWTWATMNLYVSQVTWWVKRPAMGVASRLDEISSDTATWSHLRHHQWMGAVLLLASQWLRRKCRLECALAMAWQWGERREEEGGLARVARKE